MTADLDSIIKGIKLIITDVDGVLTDGSYMIGDNGLEFKRFHSYDGAGIAILKAADFPLAIISGRNSQSTLYRMRELGLEDNLYQGNLAKLEPYNHIKTRFNLKDSEICYIGDDLVDIPLLKIVGLPVTVNNAPEEIRGHALYITKKRGGEGALREIIELVLKGQEKFTDALKRVTKDTYRDG